MTASEKPPPGEALTRELSDEQHAHRALPAPLVTGALELGMGDMERLTAEPRYEFIELLGRGGMGDVWLCRDLRVQREVAMKTIAEKHLTNSSVLMRMLREAEVQGQLDHPAIVPVHDLGLGPRGLFFTMKRVRGVSLAEVLRGLQQGDEKHQARHTTRRLLAAFVTVCLAVDYAHQHGILHRDLKPANIMLGDFGEVYVLDWGVAKVLAQQEPTDLGSSWKHRPISAANINAVVGTPGYMAPEQARGSMDQLDARTDVYALGAILFEILTLRRLHEGNLQQIFVSTAALKEGRPAQQTPDRVPAVLDELCARATQASPADRLPSARALAEAVEEYLDGELQQTLQSTLAAQVRQRAHEAAAENGSSRATALREAAKAVALDPSNAQSLRLLETLLDRSEQQAPAEAEAAFSEVIGARGKLGGRLAWGRVAMASAILVLLLALPAREGVWRTSCLGIGALSIALNTAWIVRKGEHKSPLGIAAFLGTLLLLACSSGLLGPFTLIPTVLVLQGGLSLIVSGFRLRAFTIGACALTFLAPLALSWAGLISPLYEITPDAFLLPANLARFAPWLGPALALVHLLVVVMPLLLFCQLHDQQSQVDRRVFLQAWHLRNLGRS